MFNQFYNGKKVLVTGHTGFKGSWLSKWLLKLGAEVVGISDRVPTTPSHFDEIGLQGEIDHIICDVKDYVSLRKHIEDIKPDVVFHLAAQAIVSESYANPVETFATNALGTINLLSILNELNRPVNAIFITSDKCYENVEWIWGYRENDQLGGKDPYSASKACAEIAFSSFTRSMYGDNNVNAVSVRAGNVIGGGDWAKDRLIVDCVKSWSVGESVSLRNPSATRPWQLVLEPLSGYLLVGTVADRYRGESFNFGPQFGSDKSVGDVVDDLADVFLSSTDHEKANRTESNMYEAGLLRLNCDKALSYLGWVANLTYDETINFTGSWYRDFYNGASPSDLTDGQIEAYVDLARERGLVWTKI